MSNIKKYSFFFLLLLICWSCSPDVVITENPPFFDLKAFFESEIPKLNQVRRVKKTITYDKRTEEKTLASSELNFEEELQIFVNSDINRTAWLDKYEVDSTFNNLKEISQIIYTTKDPNLKTKSLRIDFQHNLVTKVVIENATGSYLSSATQHLFYESGKGYQIESDQTLILFSDQALTIQVSFED